MMMLFQYTELQLQKNTFCSAPKWQPQLSEGSLTMALFEFSLNVLG